jgi:hypothetical protein
MSKMQRAKGAQFEREVVENFRVAGYRCSRNLSQTRDGGGDILLDDLLIECKRRASIAVYDWLDQATTAAEGRKPIVVARGDKRECVVILRLVDFLDILRKHHGKQN